MYGNKRKPIKNHGIDWTPYQVRMKNNLNKYMKEKHLSIMDLYRKTQIPYQVIQDYTKGNTATPPLKNVNKLAWGLGISLKELLA